MKRLLAALLLVISALASGCGAKPQIPPNVEKPDEAITGANVDQFILASMQKGDFEALSNMSGAQGLRVGAYASDGGSQVSGQQLTEMWKALLKDSKPELVARNGSGQVLHLAVKGLNQVDLPGQPKLRSTELVQLSIQFDEPSKYRLVAFIVDNQGLLTHAVNGGDRWVPYEKAK